MVVVIVVIMVIVARSFGISKLPKSNAASNWNFCYLNYETVASGYKSMLDLFKMLGRIT